MTPRAGSIRYLLAGRFANMAWTEWGDPHAPPVICVHGLTRNGRDFDALAQDLATRFRVICPDLPGRGASDWLPDYTHYVVPSYVVALSHLLAMIGQPVCYVGTSLGGICGMALAACEGHPITRMVLNDIGPSIPKAALARIRTYMSQSFDFADMAALEQHLRIIHYPFGPLTDAQWAHLARYSARPLDNGRIGLHYDPGIARQVQETEPADIDLWAVWNRIHIPLLTLRGETSDILHPDTFGRMAETGSRVHTVIDTGHAPAIMDETTISVVKNFLSE